MRGLIVAIAIILSGCGGAELRSLATPAPLPTETAQRPALVAIVATMPPTATPAPQCVVVASDGNGGGAVWLRAEPDGAQIRTLARGAVVPFVYQQADGWIFTGSGFVYRDFVECEK